MMIRTKVCEILGIEHPLIMAAMGGASTPELVAAVSNAGGLGILPCTWMDADALRSAIGEIRSRTNKPFGLNFVLHQTDPALLDACLADPPPLLSFFRGQPVEAIARARDAGAVTMHQVTTVEEAREAASAGVDIIVAQGREAGGHMGPMPLWSLLPEIIDAIPDVPILAAGGLVDGRDLAAALTYGAAGVVMGTRFLASYEAPVTDSHKQAIVNSRLGDTLDSPIWDMLGGRDWPGVKVRAFRNATVERWHGREAELSASMETARAEYFAARETLDDSRRMMLAGEGAARIRDILPAAQIVREIIAEAEAALRRAGATIV